MLCVDTVQEWQTTCLAYVCLHGDHLYVYVVYVLDGFYYGVRTSLFLKL